MKNGPRISPTPMAQKLHVEADPHVDDRRRNVPNVRFLHRAPDLLDLAEKAVEDGDVDLGGHPARFLRKDLVKTVPDEWHRRVVIPEQVVGDQISDEYAPEVLAAEDVVAGEIAVCP